MKEYIITVKCRLMDDTSDKQDNSDFVAQIVHNMKVPWISSRNGKSRHFAKFDIESVKEDK